MTRQSDLKTLIRARMAVTGERYTAAAAALADAAARVDEAVPLVVRGRRAVIVKTVCANFTALPMLHEPADPAGWAAPYAPASPRHARRHASMLPAGTAGGAVGGTCCARACGGRPSEAARRTAPRCAALAASVAERGDGARKSARRRTISTSSDSPTHRNTRKLTT